MLRTPIARVLLPFNSRQSKVVCLFLLLMGRPHSLFRQVNSQSSRIARGRRLGLLKCFPHLSGSARVSMVVPILKLGW